uniref:DNA ligase n=1 Tax=Pithovirus LCPAC001 TaxID=2506585 RepID=A0A481Z1D1_9VIRU|nr:MAG: ATP-dependent DNA ligase [Pithovirus LCPAC001]
MEFPTLYFNDKLGRKRLWKIWVKGDTVYREGGLVDGKKVNSNRTFKSKNIGKKNETSAEEQAKREAERDWIKKLGEGRTPDPEDVIGITMMKQVTEEKLKMGGVARTVASKIRGRKTINMKVKSPYIITDLEKEPIIPMKANKWELDDKGELKNKIKKYFKFENGVWVQPKLDGYRCIAKIHSSKNGKKVILSSNGRKQFPWFEHIRKEVLELGSKVDLLDGLDGELYIHQKQNFSTIQSMCAISSSKPHPNEAQIILHVFDLVDESAKISQEERLEKLDQIFKFHDGTALSLVPTHKIKTALEVNTYHQKFIQELYEGVIVRSNECVYMEAKSKRRSLYLRKYKDFKDEEYKVIGIELDSGVSEEYFVWLCTTEKGIFDSKHKNLFKAKPMGTRQERIKQYKNHQKYIGKLLKVRFQEYTEDGIPRFPIGVCFREKWDLTG